MICTRSTAGTMQAITNMAPFKSLINPPGLPCGRNPKN